jgi:hypothetical protein
MPNKSTQISANVVGVALIVFGILVSLGQSFDLNLGRFAWPLFILVPGLALLVASLTSNFGGKALTTFGTMTTITGLLLAYQNTFDHFESWAYAWSLVTPFGMGLGLILHGRTYDDPALVSTGRRMAAAGAAIFVVGTAFFELILNISGRGIPNFFSISFLLPAILIGAGVVVLLWRFRPAPNNNRQE